MTAVERGDDAKVGFLGFMVMLAIAVTIGFIGDSLVPGEVPFGWAAATVVGMMGSLVGTALLGGWGPGLGGVYLLPAILGSVVFIALLELALSAFVARSSS